MSAELAEHLVRLVVIVAAGVAAVPLVRRSADRRSTCLAIVFGIVLATVPSVLHLAEALGYWHLDPPFTLLNQVDAPGFALILFGVALGLRNLARRSSELRDQNTALKREASTDFLTGLLNRRQADFLLDYGAARARRSGDPLGFIMIDLDHFKAVNDVSGHQAGDAVLAHVGRLLKSRMRGSDIVARYGGEEFLVVVADPNPEGIVTLAEDLRQLIEERPAEYDGQQIPITASFGVAISSADTGEAVQSCIGKADTALYAAKEKGRNQVVGWNEATRQPVQHSPKAGESDGAATTQQRRTMTRASESNRFRTETSQATSGGIP
jgi:diguanylate cyclase (GGDEF)-like protein